MPKKKAIKQALSAIVLTLAAEIACLLLFAWTGSRGWTDPEHLLGAGMAAACMGSAAGASLLAVKKWGAVQAGLIITAAGQLTLLTAGYLLFGGMGFSGGRWCLPIAAFLSAVTVNLLVGKRTRKTKRKRKAAHRRKAM